MTDTSPETAAAPAVTGTAADQAPHGRPVLVYSEALTGYDFGSDHAMSPGRVREAVALAGSLGVLDRLDVVPPPPADDALLATVHTPDYIDAVRRCGADERYGLGTSDNPVFPRMHEVSSQVVTATVEAARQVWEGDALRASNIAGGLHHAMPEQDERLLRLQRRRRRDPLAAGPRGRAGRVRRRRRASRRRRADGLLGRPARADGEPARDAGVPVPGHGLPDRDRRARRSRQRRQRRPAARDRRLGLAARVRRDRPAGPRGASPAGPRHAARLRLAQPRPAGRPRPLAGRAARLLPGAHGAGGRAVRGPLGVDRRRRLRRAARRPARLDPPAGHRRRASAATRRRRRRSPGATGSASTPRRRWATASRCRSGASTTASRPRAGSTRRSSPPVVPCSPSWVSTPGSDSHSSRPPPP